MSDRNKRIKILAVLGEKKAIKCSSSLDTKEALGILTFIVAVYIYVCTLSPTLRTNNAENTWQPKQQAVDGNILLPASVAWLFLTCSLWWRGLRHSFSQHSPADPTNWGGESRSGSLHSHTFQLMQSVALQSFKAGYSFYEN